MLFVQKAIGSLKMKRRTAAALWPKKNLALENVEVTQVCSNRCVGRAISGVCDLGPVSPTQVNCTVS